MEDPKTTSDVIGAEPATAITPPPSFLAAFDVNNFLKKTFSDYDIGHDGRDIDQQPSSSVYQRGRRSEILDGPISSAESNGYRRKSHQRRAGSVPATTQDRLSSSEKTSRQTAASEEPLLEEDRGQSANGKASSRRGRRRERDERLPMQQPCAYCGQEVSGRSRANPARGLYCAACTSFFTRHSPSELQRRIAFDEMTQPSAAFAVLAVASVGSSSGTAGDNKETVPLLCATDSKVVIVANDNRDDEEEDSENREILQKKGDQEPNEEVEGVSRYRYTRNDRPQGRGHAGRLQVKARQAPDRQHQQQLRTGRVQLRDDSSSKMDSWCGDSASVVVWNKDNHGNNSRRSSLTSASSLNRPTCRICHLYGEPGETLVSPCRCAGTMQYVHTTCLVHWLEISTKKVLPSPQCELCGYHYRTHHCYRLRRMHAPTCNRRDRLLHVVFVFMILVMIGCAALSAVYLRYDKGTGQNRVSLRPEDIVVIASALLFFCAFFVAVFTQYRAETSVCRLCLRCWLINRHWRVKDYDRSLDYELPNKAGHSVVMEQI